MSRRVLISGAGIAGLTAAYWMHHYDWEVTILEKSPELRRGEFVIDFAGTGWDVATKMGLEGPINALRSPLHELRFEDGQGRAKAQLAIADFVSTLGVEGKHASINRKDLQDLLYQKITHKAEIRFSSSIQNIREESDHVMVQIEPKGSAEAFDLLIGADGLHSNLRNLHFGPEADFAHYLGYQVAAFRSSGIAEGPAGVMRLQRLPSKQAGILNLGNGDSLALFVYADPKGDYIPRANRKEVLARNFQEMGGIVPPLIDSIDEHTSLYLDSVTQINMPRWSTPKTALIGDAAYCLTLVSGQGASMAMAGAYLLADSLHQEASLRPGLARYEQRLRPFVERLQAKTRSLARSFVPAGNLGLWASELGMRALGFPWIRKLAARQISIQSLLEIEAKAV